MYKSLDIPEIQSLDLREVVTYKAKEAYKQIKHPVLVEDTSLRFYVLGNLPGPLIKWFLEELGKEGVCKLLDGYSDRSAVAEVVYGLHTGKEILFFEARVDGIMAGRPKGENGFGWDATFIPIGCTKTWGKWILTSKTKPPSAEKQSQNLIRTLCYTLIQPRGGVKNFQKYLLNCVFFRSTIQLWLIRIVI